MGTVMSIQDPIPTGIALLLLALIAFAVPAALGMRLWREPITALLRAGVQLTALSLVLSGVISDIRWVALALLVMLAAAAFTAARRIGRPSAVLHLLLAIAIGPAVALIIVFATGALTLSSQYLLATGGIIVGNSMTIATLAARMLQKETRDHWAEVEGWLALGASFGQATAGFVREAIRSALIPSLDQTKTTGIVVLPGAFVGAVFAGASPLEAGRFQLIVLASILASGMLTASLVTATIRTPATLRP